MVGDNLLAAFTKNVSKGLMNSVRKVGVFLGAFC